MVSIVSHESQTPQFFEGLELEDRADIAMYGAVGRKP
jgi:hypothetical protein